MRLLVALGPFELVEMLARQPPDARSIFRRFEKLFLPASARIFVPSTATRSSVISPFIVSIASTCSNSSRNAAPYPTRKSERV